LHLNGYLKKEIAVARLTMLTSHIWAVAPHLITVRTYRHSLVFSGNAQSYSSYGPHCIRGYHADRLSGMDQYLLDMCHIFYLEAGPIGLISGPSYNVIYDVCRHAGAQKQGSS
jgi:hypothetical protein